MSSIADDDDDGWAPPKYPDVSASWDLAPRPKDVAKAIWDDTLEDISSYARMPRSPFDVFAFVSFLLEQSGAYHHILPAPDRHRREATLDELDPSQRIIWTFGKQREHCKKLGDIWQQRLDLDDTKAVSARAKELGYACTLWWRLLAEYGDEPVFHAVPEGYPAPGWWWIAHELMMIADEASRNAGFDIKRSADEGWDTDGAPPWFVRELVAGVLRDYDPISTTFSNANADIVCVMPKSRTTPVGCTLRSLSHNIALLPGQGVARANWAPRIWEEPSRKVHQPDSGRSHRGILDNQFNLLLIPFPYSIRDQDFGPSRDYEASHKGWGFFSCNQTWLKNWSYDATNDIVAFIRMLVADAKKKGAKRIDGVVFPELALNYAVFSQLRRALKERMPDLRVIIAGLSSDQYGREGNFVGVYSFLDLPFDASDGEEPYLESVREKHHRWQLDRAQIEGYGLEGVLDPRRRWWENIRLLSRRVEFTVFHENSALAAMICEDLARVDPCQGLLRSIGPNLVIALLMDAPQLETRWPARYATILAEDPGCSVLTLTSRGLTARQRLYDLPRNMSIPIDDRPVIALWRDADSGRAQPIRCGFDCQAVWIKLDGMNATDLSLDGRSDDRTLSWIMVKQRELRVEHVDKHFHRVVGDIDRQVREKIEAATKANGGRHKLEPDAL